MDILAAKVKVIANAKVKATADVKVKAIVVEKGSTNGKVIADATEIARVKARVAMSQ